MNQSIHFNRRTIAYLALNAFGIIIIYLLSDFITPFLGALIFYVLFSNLMERLAARNWKEPLAAIFIIIVSFVIILIPVIGFCYMTYSKIASVISNPEAIINSVKVLDQKFLELTGKNLLSEDLIIKLQAGAGQLIPSFLGRIFVILGNIALMYFMLYYMLVQRKKMISGVNNYLPFNRKNIGVLSKELESQTLSNAIGVPLIAVIQGVAAGIGYWIFGVPEPIFWAMVTAVASVLPLVGSTLVWGPAALILIASGELWMGIGLAAYGGVVVINIDNVARLFIQKRFADVHPLITVFGVILGLNIFGLPGLIFGPLMLSYFVIFVKMYRSIYSSKDKDEDETEEISL